MNKSVFNISKSFSYQIKQMLSTTFITELLFMLLNLIGIFGILILLFVFPLTFHLTSISIDSTNGIVNFIAKTDMSKEEVIIKDFDPSQVDWKAECVKRKMLYHKDVIEAMNGFACSIFQGNQVLSIS